jgi:hypothetical protein
MLPNKTLIWGTLDLGVGLILRVQEKSARVNNNKTIIFRFKRKPPLRGKLIFGNLKKSGEQ